MSELAERLRRALDAWSGILGQDGVDERPALRDATFATRARVLAALRPRVCDQVRGCLQIAQLHGVPLYPVSRGRNWGFGSSLPSADAVLLDLSRLDRIVNFDETLQHVTVEPGVSFRQLHAFLRERGSRLMIAPGPGSPDGSVLANALERGHGLGAWRQRFGAICGQEVVLPDGAAVRTGALRFDTPDLRVPYGWPAGPIVDGLFSQSPLGVVTQAMLRLQRQPRLSRAITLSIAQDGKLPALVDALRELIATGFPAGMLTLFNDCKVFALHGQYPWDEAGGQTPLPAGLRQRMQQRIAGGAWAGEVVIASETQKEQAAGMARVRAVLRARVNRLAALPEIVYAMWPVLRHPYRWFTGTWMEQLARLDLAALNDRNLRCAYWRKRPPPPAPAEIDLDRDRCGFVTLLFVTPLHGERIGEVCRQLDQQCLAHGLEPNIGILPVDEGCAYLLVFLIYDRDVAGEDERALACHDALAGIMRRHGLVPARLGVQSMDWMHRDADPGYGTLLGRLRDALDPGAVLAPGRYPPA